MAHDIESDLSAQQGVTAQLRYYDDVSKGRGDKREHRTSFFVARVAALPLEAFDRGGECDLRELAREQPLRTLLQSVAPGLRQRVDEWLDGASDEAVATAVLRYLTRWTHRPVPANLAGAIAVGSIGGPGTASSRFRWPI